MSALNISPDAIDQYRESAFVGLLFGGALIFSLGMAFLIIGVSINTSPPAPYITQAAKQWLIGGSFVAMVVGAVCIRFAARIVGW